MFLPRKIQPDQLVSRIAQLIPEYLPGMDTGAAEPTDRRRCWSKTLIALLTAIGKAQGCTIELDESAAAPRAEQMDLFWKSGDGIALAAFTGWGDRKELDTRLQRALRLKAGQKLFVYTCSKWQEAVLEQIHAALLRYPFHIEGEQYTFVNLLGAESILHAHLAEITASGALPGYDPRWLNPVKGSPLKWTAR